MRDADTVAVYRLVSDRVALRRNKCDQDVKGFRRERDTIAISKQRMPIGVQMVRAKFVLTAGRHRADQRSAHVSSRSLLNSASQELDIRES
jgi:hypothetical protein